MYSYVWSIIRKYWGLINSYFTYVYLVSGAQLKDDYPLVILLLNTNRGRIDGQDGENQKFIGGSERTLRTFTSMKLG